MPEKIRPTFLGRRRALRGAYGMFVTVEELEQSIVPADCPRYAMSRLVVSDLLF